jgi:hypothetical protein
MTTSLQRAEQICQKLEANGIRATTDVGNMAPPCVLVNLPIDRTNDLNCGVTVTWTLDCVAPAPGTWDRTAWALLEALVLAVESVLPIERSHAQPFMRPGAGGLTTYPSYESTFQEAL